MKRTIIGSAILAVGLFGGGIAIGQIGGIPGSSAASAVATATTTQTVPDRGGHPDGAQDAAHADGTVSAINGDTLTIASGNDPAGTDEYAGVTTVNLTSATQYDAGHDSTGTVSKSSIKVGSYVIVEGTVSSDGKTITATSLGILPGGGIPGR
jgi:hypothetical protein